MDSKYGPRRAKDIKYTGSLDFVNKICQSDHALMKRAWHILTRMVVVALTAVWILTTAHAVVSHSDSALSGNGDDACAASECVCICACHAAVEPSANLDVCAAERIPFVQSEYVTLLGTSVPSDIFRPPLANS